MIPAYKVEKYIKRCLNSIIASKIHDCELLLINRPAADGQADATNRICQQYAGRYPFIKRLYQDGTGLSNARNKGMEEASGFFLLFMDADDFVDSDKLRKFTELIRAQYTDHACIVNDFYWWSLGGKPRLKKQIYSADIMDFLSQKGSYWNVWRYAYNLAFLRRHQLRFAENRMCEDVDFTSRIFMSTDKIAFLHCPYYCYDSRREDSLYNAKGVKYVEDLLKVSQNILWSLDPAKPVHRKLEIKVWREIVFSLPLYFEVDRPERARILDIYKKSLKRIQKISPKQAMYVAGIHLIGIKKLAFILLVLKKIKRKAVIKK